MQVLDADETFKMNNPLEVIPPVQSPATVTTATKNLSRETIESTLLLQGWTKAQIDPFLHSPLVQVAPEKSSFHFQNQKYVSLSLRLGLAFVFTFAAISLSLNPEEGKHFLPAFVSGIIPAKLFLTLFGFYEIILSVWLLTGKFTKYSGLLSAITLIGITSLNMNDFSVLFRNVAIIFAAVALVLIPSKKNTSN